MLDFLKHLLSSQNQFASGGLLLMIIGSVGVFLRSLPELVWEWIVRHASLTITVTDDDAAFQWVKEWLLEQKFLKRLRDVDLDTTLRGTEMALIPAPGRHLFWHEGRPFWVWFQRSDEAKGKAQRRTESLTFRTVGRDQAFLRGFADEIVACHRRKSRALPLLYIYDDYWARVEAYSPRVLDSVILKPGEKEHLIGDVERFRASRARYRKLGVPYHRGYLLYGPPGTGKTSLISALAARFGMSIYTVNLTEFSDKSLKMAMNDVPENSVILFEDIDCMKASRRRKDEDGPAPAKPSAKSDDDGVMPSVTLSGLLNVLDGFHAPENVIFAMTTNKIEALDPALLRPGRIDYRLYMGEATESQRVELYRRFFPESTEVQARAFAEAHCTQTMAEFQGMLLALEEGERLDGIECDSTLRTAEAQPQSSRTAA